VTDSTAPYCDACGCLFSRVLVTPPASSPKWKYRVLAIAVGLAVAIGVQLIRQFLLG
jgi:hypothetical protein